MTTSPAHSTPAREVLRTLNWPLAIGLGLFALVRPLASITGVDDILGRPLTPILLTVLVSIVWILAVGLSRAPSPFVTVLAAAATYAVASTLLSAILSPILLGELQGPLANPFALLGVLGVNAAWGAAAGGLAVLVRRARRGTPASGGGA